MQLVRMNSLRGFDHLWNAVAADAAANVRAANASWQPAVDIREGKDSYSISLDVPAVEPTDIKVAVHDGVLTISGERPVEKADVDTKVHRAERRVGKFSRSFTLPEDANADAIEATAKSGVLTVRITKRAERQPVAIEVKVS